MNYMKILVQLLILKVMCRQLCQWQVQIMMKRVFKANSKYWTNAQCYLHIEWHRRERYALQIIFFFFHLSICKGIDSNNSNSEQYNCVAVYSKHVIRFKRMSAFGKSHQMPLSHRVSSIFYLSVSIYIKSEYQKSNMWIFTVQENGCVNLYVTWEA